MPVRLSRGRSSCIAGPPGIESEYLSATRRGSSKPARALVDSIQGPALGFEPLKRTPSFTIDALTKRMLLAFSIDPFPAIGKVVRKL